MCIKPIRLPSGVEVACHECWQCKENAISDWEGRCIAESKSSGSTFVVTLTYGRDATLGTVDHERAVLLTYSDVQKYIKLLRFHGYPVRYFCTGEFGSYKGRTHWHLVLFFEGRVPEHALNVRFMHARLEDGPGQFYWDGTIDQALERRDYAVPGKVQARDALPNGDPEPSFFWPHGWSEWELPEGGSVRYACKYIQADVGDYSLPKMSKYPPLGARYFEAFALDHVRAGLAPQSLQYWFPEVRKIDKKSGRDLGPIKYMLSGRTAELFCEAYIRDWAALRPHQSRPVSELIDLFDEYGRVVWDESFLPPASGRGAVLPGLERAALAEQRAALNAEPVGEAYGPGISVAEYRVRYRRSVVDADMWQTEFEARNGIGDERQQIAEEEWRSREYVRRDGIRSQLFERWNAAVEAAGGWEAFQRDKRWKDFHAAEARLRSQSSV